ncbi:DUF4097 family beta strand repeat-containing protein [Glycomyces tenuis]|uniref:DUF4097 family beta strand repeat-containing protein n=1 Tax=Glycomyces tenuis TaxID=58116 RepID=UPI0003F699C6|nr:DUF4097 family beta strand repeat-containing protein [Glycomyces tenuis]
MTTIENDAPTEAPAKQPRRKAWLVVGGALTAVILLFVVAVAGVLIWSASSPRETDSRAQTYESVAGVDLDVAVGSVSLTGGDGAELSVESDMHWKGPEPQVEEELTADGVFEARAQCGEDYLFWLLGAQCEVDYSAAVPSGTPALVRTSVADIDVDGLDGELDIETTTGEVDARNLRTSDTSITSTTADVTVSFAELTGGVDISTTTGNVTVLVPDDGTAYEVRYDSTTGAEEIGIATDPSETNGQVIDVTTTTGNLEVRYVS